MMMLAERWRLEHRADRIACVTRIIGGMTPEQQLRLQLAMLRRATEWLRRAKA